MPDPSTPRPAFFIWAAVLCGGLLLGTASRAQSTADDSDASFYRRTSVCAAVMKRDMVELRTRSQRGETNLRGEMQRLAELSFAFVGTAYKRGLRKPQADQLLEEAERTQAKLPAPALRQIDNDCQAEANRILKSANVLERALVRNRAKARVEEMLPPA